MHRQITDLMLCPRNVLVRASKSCHQSKDTCSKDNCFQRGRCPATLFTVPLCHRHTHRHTHSLSLSAWYDITQAFHFSLENFLDFVRTLSPSHWTALYTLCSSPCHSLIPSPHSHTPRHTIPSFFSLPHPFSFFPHFKTDDTC